MIPRVESAKKLCVLKYNAKCTVATTATACYCYCNSTNQFVMQLLQTKLLIDQDKAQNNLTVQSSFCDIVRYSRYLDFVMTNGWLESLGTILPFLLIYGGKTRRSIY